MHDQMAIMDGGHCGREREPMNDERWKERNSMDGFCTTFIVTATIFHVTINL